MKHNDLNVFESCSKKDRDYIVGLIFSDGCLSQQKGKSERITLALKDLDIYDDSELYIQRKKQLFDDIV